MKKIIKFMFNKDINNKFHEIIIRKKIVMIFFLTMTW